MGTVRYTVLDGEIVSENRNGVIRDYVPDPLGSTVALLDNTQTITDTFSYFPSGTVASRTGTTATPFQFVGTKGYHADASGKTYVRARVLEPQKGRWLTEDPIGFMGRDWNLYRYVMDQPSNSSDPSGRFDGSLCFAAGILDPIVGILCSIYCITKGRKVGVPMPVLPVRGHSPSIPLPGWCSREDSQNCLANCVQIGRKDSICVGFYLKGKYLGSVCKCKQCPVDAKSCPTSLGNTIRK